MAASNQRGQNLAYEDDYASPFVSGGVAPKPSPPAEEFRQDLGWLSTANTSKALEANPTTRADLTNMLAASGDTRTPAQWLYDDLLGGDTNTFFADITKQASGLFGNLFGNSTTPTNPPVTAPNSPADDFFAPEPETPGGGGMVNDFNNILAEIIGLLGKPSSDFTNAPVTNTETTINTTVDNSIRWSPTTTNNDYSSTNITYGFGLKEMEEFMSRFVGFLPSVPSGGNGVISPASPTIGYAPNPDQSTQRLGGQTIASVGGLELNTGGVGVGGMGFSWKTILLTIGASLIAMYLFKRFAR